MHTLSIQCIYDSRIHEFDRSMANVSIGLAQDLMVEILIIKVGFKRTRSGFSTYIDKRHHGISADIWEIQWGVELYKSKRNLESPTQDNVRSDLNPLTRRYITGFLLRRLCQLDFRFYTDTLFAKENP